MRPHKFVGGRTSPGYSQLHFCRLEVSLTEWKRPIFQLGHALPSNVVLTSNRAELWQLIDRFNMSVRDDLGRWALVEPWLSLGWASDELLQRYWPVITEIKPKCQITFSQFSETASFLIGQKKFSCRGYFLMTVRISRYLTSSFFAKKFFTVDDWFLFDCETWLWLIL